MKRSIGATMLLLISLTTIHPVYALPSTDSFFNKFRVALSRVVAISYADARVLWVWGTKKINSQSIDNVLQRRAQRAAKRSGLPTVVILGMVAAALGVKINPDRDQKRVTYTAHPNH